MHRPRVIVFSIALNGYQWLYRPLFETHKRYAEKYGYDYVLVSKPNSWYLDMEVAWLKLTLLQQCLKKNYDWVVYLDADVEVNINTPAIQNNARAGKSVYAAKGFSGHINSGVLILRNDAHAREFIKAVIESAGKDIPELSIVSWGENAYVINQVKRFRYFCLLDCRWNNNSDTNLRDFIRHYSYGPLFREYRPPVSGVLLRFTWRVWRRFRKKHANVFGLKTKRDFRTQLDRLTDKVVERYPAFQHQDHPGCTSENERENHARHLV